MRWSSQDTTQVQGYSNSGQVKTRFRFKATAIQFKSRRSSRLSVLVRTSQSSSEAKETPLPFVVLFSSSDVFKNQERFFLQRKDLEQCSACGQKRKARHGGAERPTQEGEGLCGLLSGLDRKGGLPEDREGLGWFP